MFAVTIVDFVEAFEGLDCGGTDDRFRVLEDGEEIGDDGGGADGLGGFGADCGVGVLEGGGEGVEHHLLMLGILNHGVYGLVWWMVS